MWLWSHWESMRDIYDESGGWETIWTSPLAHISEQIWPFTQWSVIKNWFNICRYLTFQYTLICCSVRFASGNSGMCKMNRVRGTHVVRQIPSTHTKSYLMDRKQGRQAFLWSSSLRWKPNKRTNILCYTPITCGLKIGPMHHCSPLLLTIQLFLF